MYSPEDNELCEFSKTTTIYGIKYTIGKTTATAQSQNRSWGRRF